MVNVVRGHIFMTALAVWSLFVPLAVLVSKPDLFAFFAGMNLAVGIGVIHAYLPAMLHALRLRNSELDYEDFLVLGIMVGWTATSARIAYFQYYRQFDIVDPLVNSYVLAFFQWMTVTSGILHLSARRVFRAGIPHTNWMRLSVIVGSGIVLGTFLAATN